MSTNNDTAVLYVEDEDLIRELGIETLEDAGFEVVAVEDGTAALDALDGTAEPFCAIVTDVNLGDGPDGWLIARRARELDETLPIVYVSGGSGHEWNSKGVPDSVMIEKPFVFARIVTAVRCLLEKVKLPHRKR